MQEHPSAETGNPASAGDSATERQGSRGPAVDIALYSLARLGLLAVLTALLLLFEVPLLVALAVAVVLAMPLSLFLFGGLRRRVAAGMAERAEQRRQRRERLRAQLRGEDADRSSTEEPDDSPRGS